MANTLDTTNLRTFTGRLANDQRGVTAIVTGLGLTVLLGFGGLAIDVAQWLNASRGLQAAADQAAYSAAYAAGQNGCSAADAARTQATGVAASRGYKNGVNNTTVTTTCNSSASTFTVTISQVQPMWFTSLFMSRAPTASAFATAQLAGKVSDVCVLALDGTSVAEGVSGSDDGAATMTGSTTVNLRCGLAVDSTSTSALSVSGSGQLTATDIYMMGDAQGSTYCAGNGCYSTSPTANNVFKNQPGVEDPYAGRSFTVPSNSCTTGSTTTSIATNQSLAPGVFCNGLTLGTTGGGVSNITLTDGGVYYIFGGTLTMNARAKVTGNNVTFILTGNSSMGYATVKINGGADVSLTAPTTGQFGGLVFFQDRNAPVAASIGNCGNGNAQNKINGDSNQKITGALYFPNQAVCYTGNSSTSGAGKCTQLIARTISFTGNSDVRFSCDGTGISQISVLTPQLIK